MKCWFRVLQLVGGFCALTLGCSTNSTASAPAGANDGGAGSPSFLDGGGGIPDAPDGVQLCPNGKCNYQSQQGCASDAGLIACQPYPHDGGIVPTCAPAGSGLPGDSCSTWTDCSPGTLCVQAQCRRLCCGGDYTVCPANQHCFSELEIQVGDAAVPSGVMVCLPVGTCDVLAGGPCPNGQACHIVDPTGAVACIAEGSGHVGDDCPCAAGFTCVGAQCRRLCRAVQGGGEPSCPAIEGHCVHYDRDPVDVGECSP